MTLAACLVTDTLTLVPTAIDTLSVKSQMNLISADFCAVPEQKAVIK